MRWRRQLQSLAICIAHCWHCPIPIMLRVAVLSWANMPPCRASSPWRHRGHRRPRLGLSSSLDQVDPNMLNRPPPRAQCWHTSQPVLR